MLVNVADTRAFQRYVGVMEQKLHVEEFAVIKASVRLQLARGSVPAHNYMRHRGRKVLLNHYKRIYRTVYRTVPAMRKARRDEDDFLDDQLDILEAGAAENIEGISDRIMRDVRNILVAGVAAGLTYYAIARRLYNEIDEFSRERAATIARTETHTAAMEAEWNAIQYNDVAIQTKTWVTVGDNRVRDSHVNLEGVTIAVDQPFEGFSGPMMFPGDDSLGAGAEDIVNCRCSCIYNT